MTYLITQSLLSSWNYQFNCMEGQEENARNEFIRTLHREPGEPTPAMIQGIEFEKKCYAVANGAELWELDAEYNGVTAVANIISGAQIQVKLKRTITVHGMDILVYGILDALKAGVIYDIKRMYVKRHSDTMVYKELAGKYLNSPQHPTYFYLVPEADEFQYLVSDGENLYIEKYSREETPDIRSIIDEFLRWLESEGLYEEYIKYWEAKS